MDLCFSPSPVSRLGVTSFLTPVILLSLQWAHLFLVRLRRIALSPPLPPTCPNPPSFTHISLPFYTRCKVWYVKTLPFSLYSFWRRLEFFETSFFFHLQPIPFYAFPCCRATFFYPVSPEGSLLSPDFSFIYLLQPSFASYCLCTSSLRPRPFISWRLLFTTSSSLFSGAGHCVLRIRATSVAD